LIRLNALWKSLKTYGFVDFSLRCCENVFITLSVVSDDLNSIWNNVRMPLQQQQQQKKGDKIRRQIHDTRSEWRARFQARSTLDSTNRLRTYYDDASLAYRLYTVSSIGFEIELRLRCTNNRCPYVCFKNPRRFQRNSY